MIMMDVIALFFPCLVLVWEAALADTVRNRPLPCLLASTKLDGGQTQARSCSGPRPGEPEVAQKAILPVWQVLYDVYPFRRVGRLGYQIQIFYVGPECHSLLVAECQASKFFALPLPFFSHGLEPNVVRENHAPEIRRALQHFLIPHLGRTIVLRSHYVDAAKAKLIVNRFVHVDIKIK